MSAEMENATWTEDDSATFLDRGLFYVPERELQISTIATLLENQPVSMRIVELCPGAGVLTAALLERFADATVLALDGSEAMRAATRQAAGANAGRLEVRPFDLLDTAWRRFDGAPVHAVVSSLAVHHLDGDGKRQLFADIHAALAPGGVFVLADLTEPPSATARKVAAEAWDAEVRRRVEDLGGSPEIVEQFEADEWNYYKHVAPGTDPVDKPSSLMDQLLWLREAGFRSVDVHWMKAGHAVMSGVKG